MEKINVIETAYGFGFALIVSTYILILLGALIVALGKWLLPFVLDNVDNPTLEQTQLWFDSLQFYLPAFAVFLAILALSVKPSLKQEIVSTSIRLMGIADYQKKDDSRSAVTGQVYSLLEHMRKKRDYKKVHIFAYSFGSIIAIDALFPFGGELKQSIREVDDLVTIGCPYDLIRISNSNYFEQRYAVAEVPRKWLNVYITEDPWGNNFEEPQNHGKASFRKRGIILKTEAKKVPDENIRLGDNSTFKDYVLGWFTLLGIERHDKLRKLHASYWGDEKEHGRNAFDLVIPKIFEGDATLKSTNTNRS